MKLTDEMIEKMSREELIQRLNDAEKCIKEAGNLISENVKVKKHYEMTISEYNRQYTTFRPSKSYILIGIILGFVVGTVVSLSLYLFFDCLSGLLFHQSLYLHHYLTVGLPIFVALFSVIAIQIGYKKTESRAPIEEEKFREKAKLIYEKSCIPVEQKLKESNDAIKNLFQSEQMEDAKTLLPSKYFDLHYIVLLREVLMNRRCKTLTEAINIMEDDLHKLRMEQGMRRSAEIQRQIEENTRATAHAARMLEYMELIKGL